MPGARENRLTWDEYFMGLAVFTMGRSPDPSTRVGACVVSSDNRILSLGYNGAPTGMPVHEVSWDDIGEKTGNILEQKNIYTCHAEANAIDGFMGDKSNFRGATIYTVLFPCTECAKKIVQNGIKKVVYCNTYPYPEFVEATMKMFQYAGVTVESYKGTLDNLVSQMDSAITELEIKRKKYDAKINKLIKDFIETEELKESYERSLIVKKSSYDKYVKIKRKR